jgi:3-hydroxy acid dehydrogenase / malonic semialdehyde reductase
LAALQGKTAIVTGASSGIGAATAHALAAEGAKVAGGARKPENLETEIALELDVTDRAGAQTFLDQALEQLGGGLDILVNNAGMALGRDPFWESSDDDEETVIETNVLGLLRMTRLCLPHIRDGGHIVNLGSVAGIWSYAGGATYVASKFAVHGYTRALRDDLQGRPIRVSNIAPGLVETNFSRVRFRGDEDKASAVYSNVAMGGPLRPEDVADCIVFVVTRPPNVNIDELVVMALAQTSGANILRT